MKTFNIKPNILFFLIFNSAFFSAESQGIKDIRAFADSSYERGQYSVALKEYQRVLFFSKNKTNPHLFNSIANCYFQSGQLDRAIEYFDRSFFLFKDDSLQLSAAFNKIACYVYQGNFDMALIDVFGMPDSLPPFFDQRRNFYLGVIYFGKKDFVSAKKYFLEINQSDEAYLKKINQLFDPKGKINRPKPTIAFILSLIIPGSGQFYSGDIKNGVNSFLLNEGLLLLGIYTAYRYSIIDAIISVGPWFQRYYQGGLESAEKIAEQKRAENRQQIYLETLNAIEEYKNR